MVEIKESLHNKNTLAIATDQIRSALSITNSRYGIVTDNQINYIYDRDKKEEDFVKITFSDLILYFTNPTEIHVNPEDTKNVLDIIRESAQRHLPDNKELLSLVNSSSFANKICFDRSNISYCIQDNDKGKGLFSTENQFFIKMLGEFKGTQVCRYSSLNTIFDMLNFISFRMNGIVGMNDKSEINYVNAYIDGSQRPIDKEHHKTISSINKRYITSCTEITRKDDLTLWRLYSDDAKGACLIFQINKKHLDDNVLLQKVSYAHSDGTHNELDLLKQIKKDVESLTGFKFQFRKINYWKHFFKPYDYAIEEEVRLLIIDTGKLDKIKTDWVMTYTHSIINPIIDFSLNSTSFPIQLRKIILGPKCPEPETNLVQFQEMIRRKREEVHAKSIDSDLTKLKVELSTIKHYR